MNLQPSQDYKSLWDVNYSGQQFTNTSDSTHVYLKKEGIKQNFSILESGSVGAFCKLIQFGSAKYYRSKMKLLSTRTCFKLVNFSNYSIRTIWLSFKFKYQSCFMFSMPIFPFSLVQAVLQTLSAGVGRLHLQEVV
ncbi:Hypothetical_protein [Hexamita inflata]|uniref:Hypothetical_protein n=1 Tax=Hexamita inflata TaxID=28002 RepID=A0AA86PEF4_9EUKA|nr:Hypothetical protein HINF_LOCUS25400 [Hexamita inflata]